MKKLLECHGMISQSIQVYSWFNPLNNFIIWSCCSDTTLKSLSDNFGIFMGSMHLNFLKATKTGIHQTKSSSHWAGTGQSASFWNCIFRGWARFIFLQLKTLIQQRQKMWFHNSLVRSSCNPALLHVELTRHFWITRPSFLKEPLVSWMKTQYPVYLKGQIKLWLPYPDKSWKLLSSEHSLSPSFMHFLPMCSSIFSSSCDSSPTSPFRNP